MAKNTVRRHALGTSVAAVVIVAMLWSIGGLFGLTRVQTVAAGLVLVVVSGITWTSNREVSPPFVLLTVALLAVIYAVLPSSVQQATPVPDVLRALGMSGTLEAMDAAKLAGSVLMTVLLYWIVILRAGRGPQRPETVFSGIFGTGEGERKGKLTQVLETYITMGRVALGFIVFGVATIAMELGDLLGIVVGFLGEAPVALSNLLGIVVGFLALENPFGLGLTTGVYAAITVIALSIAIGVRNQ